MYKRKIMREILFRGKRTDNGEWVFGVFIPDALETVIYKNGDAFAFGYSAFYAGSLDCLVPIDKNIFSWHIDRNATEFMGETVFYLTLGELAEQLAEMRYTGLLTLFVNRTTSGEIYQLGNYGEYEWSELGELRGFC